MAQDVEIVIGAQDRASQVLSKVGSGVSQLGAGMKMLGPVAIGAAGALAAATTAVVAFNAASEVILERAKEIDSLAKAARNVGESVGDLQAFEFALGEIAGVDADKARAALEELRKAIGESLQGDQGKIDILTQLGLDAQSLSNAGPVEAFSRVRDALSQVENAAQRAAIAEKLLGGEAKSLMGLLSDQSDAFMQSMQAAEDLGLTISDAGAAGVEAMNDALGRVQAVVGGLVTQFTVEVAPAIELAADSVLEMAQAFNGVSMRDIVDGGVAFAGITYDILNNVMQVVDAVRYVSSLGTQGDLSFDFTSGTAEQMLVELEERRAKAAKAAADAEVQRIAQQRAMSQQVEQEAAASKEAEQAKASEGEKTIEALEKQLSILSKGREEYERQAQLATATTDAERARISALQSQIAAREELDEKIKNAEAEKQQRDQALANAQTGVTAVEGRLITRGNAGGDQKKMLQTQESSLEELRRIREYLASADRGSGAVEFVDIGGV